MGLVGLCGRGYTLYWLIANEYVMHLHIEYHIKYAPFPTPIAPITD